MKQLFFILTVANIQKIKKNCYIRQDHDRKTVNTLENKHHKTKILLADHKQLNYTDKQEIREMYRKYRVQTPNNKTKHNTKADLRNTS